MYYCSSPYFPIVTVFGELDTGLFPLFKGSLQSHFIPFDVDEHLMTGIYPIYDIKLFPHVVVFVMIDLLHSLMCGLYDAALLDWMLSLPRVIRITDSLVFVIVEIGVHFLAKLSILMLKEQTVE